MTYLVVTVLMLFAGLIGGLASHLSRGDYDGWRALMANLVVSELAAFATPLFLSLAKSSLLVDILRDYQSDHTMTADIFIFFGFCLIASFSARVFVNNLTSTILNLERGQRQLRSEVKEIEQDVTDLGEELQIAPDENVMEEKGSPDDVSSEHPISLEPLELHMLRALAMRPFTWRSVGGVRKELSLSRETASRILKGLVLKQWADTKRSTAGNELFRMTAAGREALGLSPLLSPQQKD